MDKIWDRNPSKYEVNGRCGGDEKTNDHAELTKVERKLLFFYILTIETYIINMYRLYKKALSKLRYIRTTWSFFLYIQ